MCNTGIEFKIYNIGKENNNIFIYYYILPFRNKLGNYILTIFSHGRFFLPK